MNTLGTLSIAVLLVGLGVASGQTACKGPPNLPPGSTFTPNQGCPLGPNYQTLSPPRQKCHCWGHCGYVCKANQGGSGGGGGGGGGKTTKKPSPCPNGGVWFNPHGQRCRCQSFNQQPYYLCEPTTVGGASSTTPAAGASGAASGATTAAGGSSAATTAAGATSAATTAAGGSSAATTAAGGSSAATTAAGATSAATTAAGGSSAATTAAGSTAAPTTAAG